MTPAPDTQQCGPLPILLQLLRSKQTRKEKRGQDEIIPISLKNHFYADPNPAFHFDVNPDPKWCGSESAILLSSDGYWEGSFFLMKADWAVCVDQLCWYEEKKLPSILTHLRTTTWQSEGPLCSVADPGSWIRDLMTFKLTDPEWFFRIPESQTIYVSA